MGFAQEYLPPNFHDPSTMPFVILLVAVLLMLLIARPRLSVTDGLLLVVWLVLSLRMVRNGPLFAIVATPILAEYWNAYLRAAAPSRVLRRYRDISARLNLRRPDGRNPWAARVGRDRDDCGADQATVFSAAHRWWPRNFPPADFPLTRLSSCASRPGRCVQHVQRVRVGGYFILAMPQRKVFLHPNLDVYGEEVVGDFLQVNGVQSGWENILRKYHVDWTILPREHRLNRLLAQRADWHLVYTDQVATIYGRIP